MSKHKEKALKLFYNGHLEKIRLFQTYLYSRQKFSESKKKKKKKEKRDYQTE